MIEGLSFYFPIMEVILELSQESENLTDSISIHLLKSAGGQEQES